MFARRNERHSLKRSPPRLEELEARTLLNAGDLDPTFGTGGKILKNLQGPIEAIASATAIQPDGKIVVAGTGYNNTAVQDLLLARYNLDGSLDSGFGSGGKVNTEFFITGVQHLGVWSRRQADRDWRCHRRLCLGAL